MFNTPKSSIDFRIWTDLADERAQRLFASKAGKRVDHLTTELVQKDVQIQQLQAQLQPLQEARKRKKVKPDPQQLFVNIEAIRAAQLEQDEKENRQGKRPRKRQKRGQNSSENGSTGSHNSGCITM